MKSNIERITNICKRLKGYAVTDRVLLEGVKYTPTEYKSGTALPVVDESWQSLSRGHIFSGSDQHFWLYVKTDMPQTLSGKDVFLTFVSSLGGRADTNPQTLVYIDGVAHTFDINHTRIKVDASKPFFECYVYLYTGVTPDDSPISFDYKLDLIAVDHEIEGLYYDLITPLEILDYTLEYEKAYTDLLRVLVDTVNLLDLRKPYSKEFYCGVKSARDYIYKKLYEKAGESSPAVACVGHTHIDIGWLWSVRQTREKAQRSFATVIDLMNEYGEYTFMSSQTILYDMVKEEDPELYQKIKTAVAEGRWEAEGSSWVEADCNLISGESLVRQILYGKQFFKEEFGVDTKILWLPDAFGYSAAMPQILQKSGVEYFVTSKISWNDTNKLPYDAFLWQGIDGTPIKTYFLTAQTKVKGREPIRFTAYNARGNAYQASGSFDRFQQKELFDETMITYGYGDGGGGTVAEDIERVKRLSHGLPNCPTTKFDTARSFLDRVFTKCEGNRYLPKWSGELYLEYHRGTYTSQAKNKRNNRKAEFAMMNAEWLSSLASEFLGKDYPKQAIDGAWKKILTNQFHDILPGTGIAEVYRESDRAYAEVFQTLEEATKSALNAIVSAVPAAEGETLVFNPTPFEFSGDVCVDGAFYYAENIPPKGYKAVALKKQSSRVAVSEKTMENDSYKIVFNENYEIESLYDKKAQRELIKTGERGNILRTYEDFPDKWDAWEIRPYYKERYWDISDVSCVRTVKEGSRTGVEITRPYLSSKVVQTVWLYDDMKRVDFQTEIDWDLEHLLLKALFPFDIKAEKATYDIQFGNVERSVTQNTSWEKAKFETCAHKYVDLSENGFGVSVMNDCKYGYSVCDGVVGLTLLKCATDPDLNADKGRHVFTYSVYSHEGAANASSVVKESYALNNPPFVAPATEKGKALLPKSFSFVCADADNVVTDTVKQAEAGDGVVVRLYECKNQRSKVRLTVPSLYTKAIFCDLMENGQKEVLLKNGELFFEIKPFEIVTVKLKR